MEVLVVDVVVDELDGVNEPFVVSGGKRYLP